MYDIVVIGGGIMGTAVARELGKYDVSVCLLEKEVDVGMGISRFSSGIVYSGCEFHPKSLKAQLCVSGNRLYESFCRELDVSYEQKGSLLLAYSKQQETKLNDYAQWGMENGVEIEWINGERVQRMEPKLKQIPSKALFAPRAGVVAAYQLPIALGESALANGVEFKRNVEVLDIAYEKYFSFTTSEGILEAQYVINAAGTDAAKISGLVGINGSVEDYRYVQYLLLDRLSDPGKILTVLGDRPQEVLRLFPTVDGYIMVGLWETLDNRWKNVGTETTQAVLNHLTEASNRMMDHLTTDKVLSAFGGGYVVAPNEDFLIRSSVNIPAFIEVAGIDDAGLTAVPTVGNYIVHLLQTAGLEIKQKKYYQSQRKNIKRSFIDINEKVAEGEAVITTAEQLLDMAQGKQKKIIEEVDGVTSSTFGGGPPDLWERLQMIKSEPPYGRIICQCEQVTESEVIQAIHRPLGARSVDGIRKRTRAGMGKCQGGFCTSQLVPLLARELDVSLEDVIKNEAESVMLVSKNKGSYIDGEDAEHEKPV